MSDVRITTHPSYGVIRALKFCGASKLNMVGARGNSDTTIRIEIVEAEMVNRYGREDFQEVIGDGPPIARRA